MKERIIGRKVLEFAKSYPVVTITGPRQSGKTTLVKMLFPDYRYVNLESLTEREFAKSDPVAFLRQFCDDSVIIDEVQRVPELLSQIQVEVDAQKRNGRFILTGSQNFSLMQGISQSLAGRTALCTLLPFSLQEITDESKSASLDEMMWEGFYPRIHDERLNATDAHSFYVDTYLNRDVREVENVKNLRSFSIFLRLAAGRTGRVLNVSSLADDAGISPKVASEWLSLLEASYIVRMLQPWHSNIGKRLVKAPKLYFLDVGLACYLLGITDSSQISAHPLRGELFETMVVGECFKRIANEGGHSQVNYYRDSNRNEIDLVMQNGQQTSLCEIKSGSTFSSNWTNTMTRLSGQFGANVTRTVVYGGDVSQHRSSFELKSWREI